ncbi:hypothetical protein H5410_053234 [Solanum commersonii]|uniref:Uncharacterized protein n=1 Tax=Solanum commersonii TaxID=4109 RepID=A0A9J5X4C4_SOLCO|nr:hypothetical protein H5410_053234 [Solanum commersonii]
MAEVFDKNSKRKYRFHHQQSSCLATVKVIREDYSIAIVLFTKIIFDNFPFLPCRAASLRHTILPSFEQVIAPGVVRGPVVCNSKKPMTSTMVQGMTTPFWASYNYEIPL